MIALFLKCLLGALAVLLISFASNSRYFVLAGLVPLFPTFALIAHFVVGTTRSPADLQQTALFGLFSLLPYAAYLATVYWMSLRATLSATLLSATLVWTLGALAMTGLWTKFHPGGA